MFKLVKKKPKKPISLREHYNRRNKVLIKRRGGGFGDILMQRMIFEDMKNQFPELQVFFTCPNQYLEMAKNHPYCEAIDLNIIKDEDYGIIFDISTCCRVHETRYGAENTLHRSDIWAEFCGIKLENHNMHLKSDPEMNKICRQALDHYNKDNKPAILLATQSSHAMPNGDKDDFGISKSLLASQIKDVVNSLKDDYFLYTVHYERQAIYDELSVIQINGIHPQAWISLVDLADCVISVDTATFHVAGGLKKPLVGVFTFTDGKIYGKYYDFILVQKHRDNKNWDCGPCFNLGFCPKTNQYPKPCLTELSSNDILQGFYEATKKWNFSKNDQKI
jgi:hypothetical protein